MAKMKSQNQYIFFLKGAEVQVRENIDWEELEKKKSGLGILTKN